ncbi:MAG: discoidin domain-containing protein [Phycisphaeraceae bacterium]
MKRYVMLFAAVALMVAGFTTAQADVYNLKVVTDASPDYSDMDSLVHSITGNWKSDEEKMWALFYWQHIARRQTNPMSLHGYAHTDPIRQYNDYGYTMCSTISGMNMSIWAHMGYPCRYYDISLHTVPEVFYGGRWHHYDNSLSVIYTLCDGKTIAGIEDIGKTLACAASGGKEEPGHIAIYHALNGTGPDGYLEGADTNRDLRHLGRDSFAPGVLKYRYYFNDAERGHRYILNLRDGEVYARHYARLDKEMGPAEAKHKSDPAYFTPNGKNKDGKPADPESKNPRYRIRGNGVRTWTPTVTAKPGEEAIYKVEGANVVTSLKIVGEVSEATVSTDNGMSWQTVDPTATIIDQVNGAYEVLVKLRQPQGELKFETITQINSKTQPQLMLGQNTVYVGAGEQTESIVLWPELQADRYKSMAVESVNVKTKEAHEGWNAVMNPADKGSEGYVVFKIDAPQDITKITQTARMYVRNPKSSISFEHSFDGGKSWIKSYTLDDVEQPWDDIHDQVTSKIPAGVKSVLFKYVVNHAGLYSVRMEANHQLPVTASAGAGPVEVTFNWSERQEDYSQVQRSHTQLVEKLPATYTINVGGFDHPVVDSLTVNAKGARGELKYGYSDGNPRKDVGGQDIPKFVGQWVTYGKNLAMGKPYTVSIPSSNNWDAGDPDGKVLTDGRVGSSYSGGTTYKEGALWLSGQKPEITVDLGQPEKFAAVRIHIHGYPGADAIKGEVKDKVEVLVSNDGQNFTSAGEFDFRLYWKDIPANYMWTDEETFRGHNHTLKFDQPIEARYVKYAIKATRFLDITEVQVLDAVHAEPFDLRIALPK